MAVPRFVYAVPGVCRGGIYASWQGCAARGVCGKNDRMRRFVGRGLDPAAPMINLKNFIMCGGRERPPYNTT